MNGLQIADCETDVGVERLPLDGRHNSLSARALACSSGGGCGDCSEILHGLNNALASMLLSAQVMEWKLPSYSRSKRYLHEIERNAQRGGELVKQLLARLESVCPVAVSGRQSGEVASSLAASDCAAAGQQPHHVVRSVDPPARPVAPPAAVFRSSGKKMAHKMV